MSCSSTCVTQVCTCRTNIAEARIWLWVKRHHGRVAVYGHGTLALSHDFVGSGSHSGWREEAQLLICVSCILWQTGHTELCACGPGGSFKPRLLSFPLGRGVCWIQGMLQRRHSAVLSRAMLPAFTTMGPLGESAVRVSHLASSWCLASSFFSRTTFPLGEQWQCDFLPSLESGGSGGSYLGCNPLTQGLCI